MKKFLTLLLLAGFATGMMVDAGFGEEKKKKKKKKADPEARFKKLDKDGDGKLTKEEFVGKRKEKGKARAEKFFDRLDKDKDGKLTLEEYKTRPKRKKKKKKKGDNE